jgi:TPP-dependent pyruvate/acetoin dehydrogenase alpha subunit
MREDDLARSFKENPMSRKSSSAGSVAARGGPADLDRAIYLDLLHKMLTVDAIEERLKIFVRAGKVSFHASTRGHEKLTTPRAAAGT